MNSRYVNSDLGWDIENTLFKLSRFGIKKTHLNNRLRKLFKQVENNPSKKVNTFLKNNIAEKKEVALKVQKQQSL